MATTPQWRELYHEVVQTNLCTGCAACIMACPRNVLDYRVADYHPVQIGEGMGTDECFHGDRGCDICTRACPRFRAWESELDTALFGRERTVDEVSGMDRSRLLVRARDTEVFNAGQDGGLVSAMLIWGLETGRIDGVVTSKLTEGRPFDAEPALVTDREGVIATAGSRYTYAANPLAMREADEQRLKQVALVGMSCQASINGSVLARNVAKYQRKIALTLGLLCSKTFTYDGQAEVFASHGIDIADVTKVNIKGRVMVWHGEDGYDELPLKEFHPHTRPGCKQCPDFAAEHADISTGGIGKSNDWTLTIVRTARGEEWLQGVIDAGLVDVRPAEEDEVAMNLLERLSTVSRKRWPVDAVPEGDRRPALLPVVSA
ncbi:Coenzyme F420 hydrogenase/dehydrogenase, beta subunit C-terminal domain [Euzebya tangerina]|uniref:Coenzyme F420 hydrogenase/dehydrogenase, beta subunit C-terminal domain n=1 Tax=Euzebya tangerina TaxID=591198 RepID=UPI000E30DFF6|nr:Coenzyme F420 hydrogenase/dehydrogenase, beta subunit C-terminal domain [Euzebya tangerina]